MIYSKNNIGAFLELFNESNFMLNFCKILIFCTFLQFQCILQTKITLNKSSKKAPGFNICKVQTQVFQTHFLRSFNYLQIKIQRYLKYVFNIATFENFKSIVKLQIQNFMKLSKKQRVKYLNLLTYNSLRIFTVTFELSKTFLAGICYCFLKNSASELFRSFKR